MDQELKKLREVASINAHKILHDVGVTEESLGDHIKYASAHYELQFDIYHKLKDILNIKTDY